MDGRVWQSLVEERTKERKKRRSADYGPRRRAMVLACFYTARGSRAALTRIYQTGLVTKQNVINFENGALTLRVVHYSPSCTVFCQPMPTLRGCTHLPHRLPTTALYTTELERSKGRQHHRLTSFIRSSHQVDCNSTADGSYRTCKIFAVTPSAVVQWKAVVLTHRQRLHTALQLPDGSPIVVIFFEWALGLRVQLTHRLSFIQSKESNLLTVWVSSNQKSPTYSPSEFHPIKRVQLTHRLSFIQSKESNLLTVWVSSNQKSPTYSPSEFHPIKLLRVSGSS